VLHFSPGHEFEFDDRLLRGLRAKSQGGDGQENGGVFHSDKYHNPGSGEPVH
jgi:hypothetical protein